MSTEQIQQIQHEQIVILNPDYLKQFTDYIDRSKATTRAYTNNLKKFYSWISENNIQQPQRADIKAYKEYLQESGYTATTQQQYLQAVKIFFKWTASENLYPNIADNIHTYHINNQFHKKDCLSRDNVTDIEKSISRADEKGKRLYFMYLLMITAGLRCIELNRANVGDIQQINGKTYLYIQGKGHTDKDTPILLIDKVIEAYNDYNQERQKNLEITAKTPLVTATGNRNKGGRIATTTISTMIKDMLKDNGLDSNRLTAHSLRHTSGTAVYKATGNIYLAQKHQRHASPTTTEIYVHAEERQERQTEQQVYNYFFTSNQSVDTKKQIIASLEELDADQLDKVLNYINQIKG